MKDLLKKLRKLNLKRRVISLLLVLVLVFGCAPFEDVARIIIDWTTLVVHAAEPRKITHTINDLNGLVTYSLEYSNGHAEEYSQDVLEITLNNGDLHDIGDNYIPLGTEDYPFDGEIYITQDNGSSWYFDSSQPLFDYVTDAVKINYSNESRRDEPIEIELRRRLDNNNELNLSPLFANHVVHSSKTAAQSATWKIKSAPYIEGENIWTFDFAGLIGTVGNGTEGVDVSIHFDNSSTGSSMGQHSNVIMPGDAGLICGSLADYSKINLTLSGSNTSCDISSSVSGNATGNVGGLVGTMGTGSVLNIVDNSFEPSSSRTISTTNGYAGGIVGYCNGGKVEADVSACTKINDSITGTLGAGALAGYYSNYSELVTVGEGEGAVSTLTPQNVTVDLENYDIDCTVSAASAGGLFGVLYSTANITVDGTSDDANEIEITGNSVSDFGGITGTYSASDLKNTLFINGGNTETSVSFSGGITNYGGVAGLINGTSPAYIKVDGFSHKSTSGYDSATAFGGVIGDAGSMGSMLDVGDITVDTDGNPFLGGGIIGVLTAGVLRLSGITDMTDAPAIETSSDGTYLTTKGQLVGKRGTALVYAIGTGSDSENTTEYNSGWRFIRCTDDVKADDIGTWGEVVRPDGSRVAVTALESKDGANTGILDFHTTNHTVTVASPTTALSNEIAFVKTALNMQLNNGNVGSLRFADSTNKMGVLKKADFTVSGTINLSGLGITGLMRDGFISDVSEIGEFTGTLTGSNSATIQLAIGEQYGVYTGEDQVGRGAIVGHRYNGLFARTGSTTTTDTSEEPAVTTTTSPVITSVTMDGTINVVITQDETYVGGITAEIGNGITVVDCNISESIRANDIGNAEGKGYFAYIGGIAGIVASNNSVDIEIKKSSGTPIINPNITAIGIIKNKDNNDANVLFAGAFGKIASKKTFTTKFKEVTVSSTISASGATGNNAGAAGLIANIVSNDENNTRKVELDNVSIKGASIINDASNSSGGLLGYKWFNTNVEMNSVSLVKDGTKDNSLSLNSSYIGGLVYQASGHWEIPQNGLTINSLSISDNKNPAGLGVIVAFGYEGTDGKDGIFLELKHSGSYTLGTGLTLPAMTSGYDELVYSTNSSSPLDNGSGIISIQTGTGTTADTLSMNGSTCNSYQNKYNKTATNSNSRYYYNLYSIRTNNSSKSDAENLLIWSLNRYAAANIKSFFINPYSGDISGTFNLTGVSYYPINIGTDDVSLGDVTVIFYNNEIEATESAPTGNTDGVNRSTRSATQHYLMHSALFKNVTKNVTSNGNMHFKGSTGSDASYSGVLINGTLTGSLTTAGDKEIVLEGVTISNTSGYLLIHGIGTGAKMTLSGVRTGAGKDFSNAGTSATEIAYRKTNNVTDIVASSLIGDVSGSSIQISFSRMKLDSRTTGSITDGNNIYGTTRSIFSNATLLRVFDVDSNSSGYYNYEESLDWNTTAHLGNVTYGQEIKTSNQYSGKEQKYYDQSHFTSPVENPNSNPLADVYDFSSGYLPYVYSSKASQSGTTPELAINVVVSGLTEGCGTYNHPYRISKGTQLEDVALMTKGTITSWPEYLRLPIANVSKDSELTTVLGKHWCEGTNECGLFQTTDGGANYKYTSGSKTYTWTQRYVRHYLNSAYYVISGNITLGSSFAGLGAPGADGSTGINAFRGVIVGANADGSIKVTINSPRLQCTDSSGNVSNNHYTNGLVSMSNGCVIKNLTVEVDFPDSDKYNLGCETKKEYTYYESFPNYGAVINKIMGGDNIIDNVSIVFKDTVKVRNKSDYNAVVGAYVGCVVNGGLIFRNIADGKVTSVINNTTTKGMIVKKVNDSGTEQTVSVNGNSITNLTDGNDLIHLYVNPLIGRVINGYAFLEGSTYKCSEDGSTYGDGSTRSSVSEVDIHNTRKNYSIPTIDSTRNYQNDVTNTTTNTLTFTMPQGASTYNTITVPDGQALYIMSIIAQSGSGCAAADDDDYSYNISYCGSSGRAYSGGSSVKDNYKATHISTYNTVGDTTKTTLDAEYVLSKIDKTNNRKSVPYIIYKYTSSYESSGNKYYPARTLTQRTFFVNLESGITYYLPDCFRGIGFLGSANYVNDNMKVYGLDGKGAVIDLNSEYFSHAKDTDPYSNTAVGNNYYGIGLFNSLQQFAKDTTDDYTKRYYVSDTEYQITNFSLQGYISGHNTAATTGEDQYNSANENKYLVTGGIVPIVSNGSFYLFNFLGISFKNFHVSSHSHAGGFIGYVSDVAALKVYINNCNANGYNIEGSGRVGGFIGTYDSNNDKGGIHINTGLDSQGKDSYSCNITNTIVNNHYANNDKWNYTAGVAGCVYVKTMGADVLTRDYKDNAYGTLVFRNITIEGGNPETNYIGNKNSPTGSAGGILGGGTAQCCGCLIMGCTVKNIDIYGRYAGGIFGETANRGSSASLMGAKIVGCIVTGDLNQNGTPKFSIRALQYAGGVYGDTRDVTPQKNSTYYNPKYKSIIAGDSSEQIYTMDIDGVLVYGYNIYVINPDNLNDAEKSGAGSSKVNPTGYAAGGLTGNNDNDRNIQNFKVEKCIIDIGTNADDASNTPCGGLIGRIASGTIKGYNIEVKDCDFYTHQWVAEETQGEIIVPAHPINEAKAYPYSSGEQTINPVTNMLCGNMIGNGMDKNVNIIAIHNENCPAKFDFNNINETSFIVYADYNGVCNTNKKGTLPSNLTTNKYPDTNAGTQYTDVSEGGKGEHFPHVNVSPVVAMGKDKTSQNKEVFLTGDAAALYGEPNALKPVAYAIVNGDKYTNVVGKTAGNVIKNKLSPGEAANGISTYKTEMGSLPDGVDDFAVVAISTENVTDSTNLINYYIQTMTNTTAAYNTVNSSKYMINIYPCTYNSAKGCFEINNPDKTAGLKYGNSTFYMNGGHADSNQGDYQFSLIDVMFLNPSNPLEIAYHLYVPVLTKKMMLFEFKSASLSGTDIKSTNFTDTNYGNTLAENLKSWFTGYVHYGYSQSELQSLLDGGVGINWNSSKTVQLKYTTSAVAKKLGGDTQIVLVDRNNADKYYYAELRDFRGENDTDGSNDTLTMATFNSEINKSGDWFEPASFASMLASQGFSIKVTPSVEPSSGYFYTETTNPSPTDVIVTVGDKMYKYVGNEGGGDRKLEIKYYIGENETDDSKMLEENYYICFRATGNSVYNYAIRPTYAIPSAGGKPTLRVDKLNEDKITNIIMGNLYTQEVSINVTNVDKNHNPKLTNPNEIDGSYHSLKVELSTFITLNGDDDAKEFILSHLQSNSDIHLYQDYVLSLTANESSGEQRVEILGSPSVTTDFTFSGNGYSDTDTQNQDRCGGNYIMLGMHDIKKYLSKRSASITATAYINFDEEWQYRAEFPVQAETDPNIGVNVSGKSNLSYNEQSLLYTSMTTTPENPSLRYFYIKDSDEASLVYNFKTGIRDEYDEAGYSSFNYSQQGENPKNFREEDRTFIPVKTVATYDATKLKSADFEKAKYIKYTLSLFKKTDGNNGEDVTYEQVSTVYDYFNNDTDSVFINVNEGVTTLGEKMTASGNKLEYTAELDQSRFTKIDDQVIDANIDFDIKTGEGFGQYANYRVVLKVELLDKDNAPIANATAQDWVVYTNAKLNPSMLSVTEAGQ